MTKEELIGLLLEQLKVSRVDLPGEMSLPVCVDLCRPVPLRLRVYLWTVTRQYGGRPQDEYKMQIILPGQKKGMRGQVDSSAGRIPVIMGYSPDFRCWILWDETCYDDYAYSRNMQVRESTLAATYIQRVARQRRIVRQGGMRLSETVLACQPPNLAEALTIRTATAGAQMQEHE